MRFTPRASEQPRARRAPVSRSSRSQRRRGPRGQLAWGGDACPPRRRTCRRSRGSPPSRSLPKRSLDRRQLERRPGPHGDLQVEEVRRGTARAPRPAADARSRSSRARAVAKSVDDVDPDRASPPKRGFTMYGPAKSGCGQPRIEQRAAASTGTPRGREHRPGGELVHAERRASGVRAAVGEPRRDRATPCSEPSSPGPP